MKKSILLAFLLSVGLSSFGVEGTIDYAFSNIVGVVKVISTNHYTIVSVPFGAVNQYVNVDEPLSLSNLVQIVNIENKDELHLLTDDGAYFLTWRYKESKGVPVGWLPVRKSVVDSWGIKRDLTPTNSSAQKVGIGWALRLYRQTPTNADGTAKPFYLIGQHINTSGSRQVKAGTDKKLVSSLISFPGIEPFDLNTIQDEGSAVVNASDDIWILDDGDGRHYTPVRGGDGKWKWGYYQKIVIGKLPNGVALTQTVRVEDDTLIPRGQGFVYQSFGGNPIIRW